jgi:hypothetical protein
MEIILYFLIVLLRFFQILNHGAEETRGLATRHTAMIKAEGQWYAPMYLDSTHYCNDIVL